MYVHIIAVITCRGRAVTNVGRTCGPTPLLAIYAIKYVYTNKNAAKLDHPGIVMTCLKAKEEGNIFLQAILSNATFLN